MFLDFVKLNTKGHKQGTKETILSAKVVLIFKYPFKNSANSAFFLLVYQQLLSVCHLGCAIYRWSGSDQYGRIFSLDWRLKHSCMVWYGVDWYGMVWYDVVWYSMMWYGMLWYGMVGVV